ncbi:prephenate dehydrogenase (plasmid) [Nicoliella spurrieriana]|uniref:Prephenate dehydrogenase n=1 Tax=Nicoliella spurrieriana TaxID=2925830 RepID=A0A976RQN6_9LACO|nr:prephenate dehydrogenase [Nicoliella spurrieriana]UQS86018.1 prephenate dehydrogenase [Nicoliella spurrieriana]
MESVFINGLGLIGSSIARIIKATRPDVIVMGNDINPQNTAFMVEHHLLDQQTSFEAGSQKADCIILATPVDIIINSLEALKYLKLKPNALVTDVGSSKRMILNAADDFINSGGTFLGGHPMAGSHLTGSANGSVNMLADHTYFLVNGNATKNQVNQFKALLGSGEFNFQLVTPDQHDQIVSAISYLPHAIAFTLMNTISPELKALNVDPSVPAGGLLDTTRIAMSDSKMWTSIMNSSGDDLIQQIELFEKNLKALKTAIKRHDNDAMKRSITMAQRARQEMEDAK